MTALKTIVIVGAGQAAASLAAKLRALGHQGSIMLIGDEPALPYERPPLSKAYLLGKLERERLYLRPQSFYDDHQIKVVTGCRVDAIDRQRSAVSAGGEWHDYDLLALTTGSVPRRLPAALGGDLAGTFVVRTLADVDAMAKECRPGRRALIVGGGYIGLEAAAVFSALEMKVTLLEMAPRILQRVAAPQTSDYFRDLHRTHGVEIREGSGLARLTGTDRVTGALLADGTELEVDIAVVGIGIQPAVDLAAAAGLALDDGIAVDEKGRTSDAAIWAAGDCASFPFKGRRIRLESVQNANDQAGLVAENMLGAEKDYLPVPWFWSDQYDVKLQIAGLNTGYDRVVVRPGQKEGVVSHWYFAGDRLLSVDAMNDPRSFMFGKRLLEAGATADPAAIANPAVNLKSLLPA
jgi:3-phenylpropionate/trans-cinnamate dioxygenase ferredoxin reductase component